MLEIEMKPAELVVDFGKAVSRKKKKHNSLFFLLKRERERERREQRETYCSVIKSFYSEIYIFFPLFFYFMWTFQGVCLSGGEQKEETDELSVCSV